MRIIVIGAGVIGLAIAEQLALTDAEVTILDAGAAMGATSSRGLAWVNASNKSPWPYFQLNAEGVRAHAEQSTKAQEPWFHQVGTVAAQSYRSGLDSRLDDHTRWGYQFSEGRLEEFLGEGGLRESFLDEEALLYPQEGWIDTELFKKKSLQNIQEKQGVVHEHTPVVSIEVSENGIHIETADGTIHVTDAVINAAGTGAPAVAAMVGRNLPMRNRWGVIAQVQTVGNPMGHVLMHDLLDIRPGLAGSHFLHSDQVDATLPENPEEADLSSQLNELLERAKQLHSMFDDAVLIDSTVGLRPIPSDGLPVIGPVNSVPGYYEAISHSGLTVAPVLGEILSRMVMKKPIEELDLSLFSANRFESLQEQDTKHFDSAQS